jgi:peptidyl-prolyl cis-trans isomerase A (cyclophilin A)
MNVVEHLFSGYGGAPDQEKITKQGNAYITSAFPKLDYIQKATIL